jgi:putative oxidoreductase
MIDQKTAPYAALVLRLTLGTMFLSHGLLKVLVFTPAGTAGFFASLGLPAWLAYPTMGAEILGGLLLIAGVCTRTVSLALIPILIGATWAHSGYGWVFSNEHGGWEYPLFLTMAAAIQVLLGDGAFAFKPFRSKQQNAELQSA